MLVFLLWYPGYLALANGVRDIYMLLLLVDVTLGPVITLIVFNPKKKELKRDLAIVAMVQAAALLYGLHAVYIARPVYVVFSTDRFDLAFANDITDEKLAKVTNREYQSLPKFGPVVIAARRPDDTNARNELLFGSLSGGDDLPQMPQYYVPYTTQRADVLKQSQPLGLLKKFNQNELSIVDALVTKYTALKIDVAYLPLKGKACDLVVIVNRNSAEILEMVNLKPWY
ncbi:putative type IV pilin accessory protein [Collimonas arenae]|nr:putative type IV pilin accessory protein [Collimonas arenae]